MKGNDNYPSRDFEKMTEYKKTTTPFPVGLMKKPIFTLRYSSRSGKLVK